MDLGLLEVLRQMPDGVVIAEAGSGELLLVNDTARELAARRRGWPGQLDLADEKLRLFYPDGSAYENDDWPIWRSLRHGEEILDEEYFQLAADGTRMWLCASCSPVRDAGGRIVAAVAVAREVTEQRRVEEELRFHASLLDNIEDAVMATDVRLRVTAWNSGAERLYGLTADEVMGWDIRDIARSDLGDAQRAEALRILLERGRVRTDLTPSHRDGTPIDVDAINLAIRDERGKLSGFLGIHRDVGERKRAERELRQAQRRTETILESISDAFVAVDRDWRYTYVNERAMRRIQSGTGTPLTRADILGQGMWELFPDVVGTEVYDRYHEAMRDGRPVQCELYFAPTDEWIEARAYPSESGLSIYYRNVSARKLAEEEMARRAEQQALVAALGQRALASVDLQPLLDEAVALVARTLDVERVGVTQLAPDAGEGAAGGHIRDVVGDSLIERALHGGAPVVVDDMAGDPVAAAVIVRIETPEPPFGVLAALSTRPRTFSAAEVSFVQAVANVMAGAVERSRTQDRLIEVRELERRRIARDLHDDALHGLAHAILLAGREGPDELVPALKRVGKQLRGAIYDLRLGGEQESPFRELLEALAAVHGDMAARNEIHLDVDHRVPDGSLGAPGIEVLRILSEALSNARRHSDARHVHVRVWRAGRTLCAEVSDDGCGLAPTGRPPAVDGAGMTGMRERAGLIHAELLIKSEPDAGTSVRIAVPLSGDVDEPAKQVRVLLVEDHASVRQAIASAFERETDFEVVGEAASLAEARGLLEDVDVAVLDLGLGDGYGADLIEELHRVTPRAQALVLSATLDRAEIARAVQCGAAGVLDKLANLGEVVDSVRRLRAGETLMPMDEIAELLRFADDQHRSEHDEREAIADLTAREREVLSALAEGLDTARMADRLHISIRTARNHISNILAKLGVHSQLQALVFALRYGVVDVPTAYSARTRTGTAGRSAGRRR